MGRSFQQQEAVGVDDCLVVERNMGGTGRDCAASNDEVVGCVFHPVLRTLDEQPVWIEKRRGPEAEIDVVPRHLIVDDLDFTGDDVVGAEGQVRHGNVLLDAIAGAVQAALMESGEVERGFAQ